MNSLKIIPTITTTQGSDWQNKIEEIKALKIKEVCVFLTVLNSQKRKRLYRLIEKTDIKKIPFVHLRSDMREEELDYFIKKYKTKVFNIHSKKEFPILFNTKKYKDKIYIENVHSFLDEKEIKEFGGVCLDFAHLENDRLKKKERFSHAFKIIKKNKIGCTHISAIKKIPRVNNKGHIRHDCHFYSFNDLSEFDYLKKYPLSFFSSVNALELENSIEEQLLAKKYISKLLK